MTTAAMKRTTSRYEALVRIGTGGMATVFVGRALGAAGFSRLVALKRAHPHLRSDPDAVASLEVEARVASCLHHANVVGVLDIEEDAGDLVIVLDYVEGCTLVELSKGGTDGTPSPSHPREIVRILLDAASGLHAAHHANDEAGQPLGIVHRDVSPSNVLVGIDGVARISDFGIAKGVGAGHVTSTGVLKGKLGYMAPEYVEGRLADARSDIFSFGVVAWEALTRRRLFKGANEVDALKRILRAEVPPLGELEPSLAPLAPVLARALARRPEDRYGSVGELAQDLEARARAAGLVANHAEVAALVQGVMGPDLVERRRRLSAALEAPVPSSGVPVHRDLVATAAVAQPEVLPTATLVQRDLVATVAVAQPEHLPTVTLVQRDLSPTPASEQPPAKRDLAPTPGKRELVPTGMVRRDKGTAPSPESRPETAPARPPGRRTQRIALALLIAGVVALSGLGLHNLTRDGEPPLAAPLVTQSVAPPTLGQPSAASSSTPRALAAPAPSEGKPPPPHPHPSARRLVPAKAPPNPYVKSP